MKKYLLALLLIVIIAPSVAFASWWNPFTWNWPWTKKVTPQEQVQQPDPIVNETPKEIDTQEGKTVTPPPVKTQAKKVSTPVVSTLEIPIPPITTTPITVVTPPAPTVTVTPVIELSIDNISTDEDISSVRVNWETSIKSESKVILNGKSYFSLAGIGIKHYADIDGLESNSSYNATITATANNAWDSKDFSFTTKPIPLQITITNKGCSSDSCVLAWETNYPSNGNIQVYDATSYQLAESSNSPSSNSKEHCIKFSLTPNTNYTFKINASDNNESTKVTGQLQVPAKIVQPIVRGTTGFGMAVSQMQYECPN